MIKKKVRQRRNGPASREPTLANNRLEDSKMSIYTSKDPSFQSSKVITSFKKLGTRRKSSNHLSIDYSSKRLNPIDENTDKRSARNRNSEALKKLKDALFKPMIQFQGVREDSGEAHAMRLLKDVKSGTLETQKIDWAFLMKVNSVLKMIEHKKSGMR